MKKDTMISIITVVYNGAATIEKTIQSVINQTYSNIEYIIIDGSSTDGTQDIVSKYIDNVSYFISEKDNGIYDAMNKGIKIANGDIIGIINSDDWYESDAVEKIVKIFKETDSDIVAGQINVWQNNEIIERTHKIELEKIWRGMVFPHPSSFIKKEVYINNNYYDISYRIAGDYDFILRSYINGANITVTDEIYANFSKGGISKDKILTVEEVRRIIYKYSENDMRFQKNREYVENAVLSVYFKEIVKKNINILQDVIEDEFGEKVNSVLIWGCGEWGNWLYSYLEDTNINIESYYDRDPQKWDKYMNGRQIKNPDALKNEDKKIIIAILNEEQSAVDSLEKLNNSSLKYLTIKRIMNAVIEREGKCGYTYGVRE